MLALVRNNRRSGVLHRFAGSGDLHIEFKSTSGDEGLRLRGLNAEVDGNGLSIYVDQPLPFSAKYGFRVVGCKRSHALQYRVASQNPMLNDVQFESPGTHNLLNEKPKIVSNETISKWATFGFGDAPVENYGLAGLAGGTMFSNAGTRRSLRESVRHGLTESDLATSDGWTQ